MKKLAAILLLAILMFNWVGYRLVISYLDHSTNLQFEARLDLGEYDESELVELKVPLSLPYQVNWRNFERFNGEIEINGIHYKYVKRKIHNDSLVLMCLPNHQKTEIQDAKSRFFALTNDLNTSQPAGKSDKKQSASYKSLTSEYLFFSSELKFSVSISEGLHHMGNQSSPLLSPPLYIPERPPAVV